MHLVHKMKRTHGHVSATPLLLPKKGRTTSRQEGFLGTPVEGLTGIPIDTPESDDRPQRVIPETTQRRLEGFCLSTPLSLSQAQDAETPTLVKDQPEQQPQQPQVELGGEQQQQQHQQQHLASLGPPVGKARHRLANISNLPPTPASGGAAAAEWCGQLDSSHGVKPMSTGGTAGRAQKRRASQATFQPGLASPTASLLGPHSAARTAAGLAPTPYTRTAAAGLPLSTPSTCGGSDDGFFLHTSQSYMRQSQPAISPSVAAGLSTQPGEDEEAEEQKEEPFTTPSQDSREPRPSPSNVTSLATTTVTTSFELPQPLGSAPCTASAHQGMQQQQPPQQHQQQLDSQAAAASGTRRGSITPGDGLGLLLAGGPEMEETTTPELEQIGLASQEGGGSQQQLSGAAATAARGSGGGGNGALVAVGSRVGRASAAGAGPSSSGRGAGVVCEEVTAKQVLFPIFRPKSQRKCVILVRHGESTYNKQDTHGKGWADPIIFDAPLTGRGRQQAVGARDKVREHLEKHGHLGSTLWLCSPLTRALETMLLAAPHVGQLAAQHGVNGSRAGAGCQQHDNRVMVLSMIAEHCATSGDVGRPASQLAAHFPSLATQLSDLPEQWWFNPSPRDSPNCAVAKVFNKAESVDHMRRRVSEFSRWLRNRPEQLVVAFGHSTFWKYFANSKQRLRNCEVLQMWW